jgi:predicted TIM-barrel fold metal-dependent hydrolase
VSDAKESVAGRVGPVIDSNVHLWDQHQNPVFWLSDRTMLREMLGNYDSLPDEFTLADYFETTSAFDVRGIVWSDAGAADPVAAAEWVENQNTSRQVIGIVSLADPANDNFERVVQNLRSNELVTSVRIRLVRDLAAHGSADTTQAHDRLLEALGLLRDLGLVATIEAGADDVGVVADIAARVPELRVVIDHFGWPDDLSDSGRRAHLKSLAPLAELGVSTRIDAIGTIFGDWETAAIRPWLQGVVELFGPDRCLLGSDIPIETLRSGFAQLYGAYDAIFDSYSDDDRALLFEGAARRVYGATGHQRL